MWPQTLYGGFLVSGIPLVSSSSIFNLFSPSLIQIIGRVNADPDYLPRAMDFGLNVSGFLEHYCPPNCPTAFFPMAAVCCDLDADKRSGPVLNAVNVTMYYCDDEPAESIWWRQSEEDDEANIYPSSCFLVYSQQTADWWKNLL